jgi:hypothetical protein
MDSRLFSLNGVAVIDAAGKLVDVISTFDLRGIVPGTFEFGKLYDTVTEFKRSIRRKNPGTCIFPRKQRPCLLLLLVLYSPPWRCFLCKCACPPSNLFFQAQFAPTPLSRTLSA